jgi:hypothetical protein
LKQVKRPSFEGETFQVVAALLQGGLVTRLFRSCLPSQETVNSNSGKVKNKKPCSFWRAKVGRAIRSFFDKKYAETLVYPTGGPTECYDVSASVFDATEETRADSTEGGSTQETPRTLADCIEGNKLKDLDVKLFEQLMEDAIAAVEAHLSEAFDAKATAAVLRTSAKGCMISAYIAHCHPETENSFTKLFRSVFHFRDEILGRYPDCHKVLRRHDFFFRSESSIILHWLKLLSAADFDTVPRKSREKNDLILFSQNLLAIPDGRVPSYLLPSLKFINRAILVGKSPEINKSFKTIPGEAEDKKIRRQRRFAADVFLKGRKTKWEKISRSPELATIPEAVETEQSPE